MNNLRAGVSTLKDSGIIFFEILIRTKIIHLVSIGVTNA